MVAYKHLQTTAMEVCAATLISGCIKVFLYALLLYENCFFENNQRFIKLNVLLVSNFFFVERLSLKLNLKIEFLLPFTGSRKVLKKTLIYRYMIFYQAYKALK